MGVMKENFIRNAHDTTFSPTGLFNFVSGALGRDASGNNRHLTEAEHGGGDPTDDSDFIYGKAEGLSHFTLYRNNNTQAEGFNYTGAMSYCCLVNTTQWIMDSANNHAQLGIHRGGANGSTFSDTTIDQRFSLQITNDGYIRYLHQSGGSGGSLTNHIAKTDRRIRTHYAWNHVAFTRDSNGTAIKLFFNGDQIHSETLSTPPGNNGNSFFAVGDVYNYNRTLTNTCVITSCVLFDQELSANQIKYLARKTLGYHRVQ